MGYLVNKKFFKKQFPIFLASTMMITTVSSYTAFAITNIGEDKIEDGNYIIEEYDFESDLQPINEVPEEINENELIDVDINPVLNTEPDFVDFEDIDITPKCTVLNLSYSEKKILDKKTISPDLSLCDVESKNLSDKFTLNNIEEAELNTTSNIYYSIYDAYSSNYMYNHLNASDRAYWDAIDLACNTIMTSNDGVISNVVNGKTVYMTQFVDTGATSGGDYYEHLWEMFKYSNPQYFFLSGNYYKVTNTKGHICLAWGVYPSFYNYSDRIAARDKLFNWIDEKLAPIKSNSDKTELIKDIHDVICKNAIYDNNVYTNSDSDSSYWQSMYSLVEYGKPVCTGYTFMFEAMCNKLDIDCMSVTSASHTWNYVKLNNGYWYVVDNTWDDTIDTSHDELRHYNFFLIDKNTIDKADSTYGKNSHLINSFWAYPNATLNSRDESNVCVLGESCSVGANIALSNGKANAPEVIITKKDKNTATVSINSVDEGDIYYSLNRVNPSDNFTKSFIYSKPFDVPIDTEVWAIVIKDGMEDSDIVKTKYVAETDPDAGKKYNVTYNLDGGKNDSKNITSFVYDPDSSKTYSLYSATKEGYNFEGWYDSTYKNKYEEINENIKGDIVLYAKFTPNKYGLYYNNTLYAKVTYNEKIGVLNPLSKTGYSFMGWKCSGLNNNNYLDSNVIYNIAADSNITPVFQANQHTVYFNGNGGTFEGQTSKIVDYDSPIGALPTPTKAGYEFYGWYYNGNLFNKNTIVKIDNDFTLTAEWTEGKYKLYFALDGGTLNSGKSYYEISAGATYPKLPTPIKTGYTFKGWYTTSDMTTVVSTDSIMPSHDVIIYAKWEQKSNNEESNPSSPSNPNNSNIPPNQPGKNENEDVVVAPDIAVINDVFAVVNYEVDGGSKPTFTRQERGKNKKTVKYIIGKSVKEGYTFKGWYLNGKKISCITESIIRKTNGNINLVAKWKVNKYKIVFKKCGYKTKGKVKTIKLNYDTAITLPENGFTRDGYTLYGWSLSSDGSTLDYILGGSVEKLNPKNNATVKLYPYWIHD